MDLNNNTADTEEVKNLYPSPDTVWPADDPWHTKTFETINNTVYTWLGALDILPEHKVLNAGAGNTRYKINCTKYDCDVSENLLVDSDNPITASIEDIPVSGSFFNGCICVGSVINYCDAATVVEELSRVLSDDGFLILEFESSDSAEFLFGEKHHKSVTSMIYSYNHTDHQLWLYSEAYICGLLKASGLDIIKEARFHTASSLHYRCFKNQDKAAKYMKFDRLFHLISKKLAHNRILLCRKK